MADRSDRIIDEQERKSWESEYKGTPEEKIVWEVGSATPQLIEAIEGGHVKPCKGLDIGCGLGTQTIYLSKKGFKMTGVDISKTAVEKAKRRAKEAKVRINFHIKNAYRLNFPKDSFGFIHDRGCFHHIPKQYRPNYVEAVHKMLAKEGKYMLMAFSDKNPWKVTTFSADDIKALFQDHFRILSHKDIVHTEREGSKVYLHCILMEKD